MPRYIIERSVGRLSRADLEAAGRRSNEVIEGMPGVVWIRSYVSDVEGKIYCEYDAPSIGPCWSTRAAPGCPPTA